MIALALASTIFASSQVHPRVQAPPVAFTSVGANLEGIADWSYSNFFADLMKQSRTFGSASAPWSGTIPVDANGWPTTDFGVILGTWPTMQGVGGVYKINCFCNAMPTIQLVASPGQITNVTRNPKTGEVNALINYPEGGGQLMLGFSNTSGGVRNLSVMRPIYPRGTEFTNPILTQLKTFSTFRFMDFAATNGSQVTTWSQRAQPNAPSYANGVPWESCIDLCNRLGKDAWINVPAMADSNYVANLAHLFHTNLNPNLHVYVEYSNEVWNWGFQQAGYNLNQAVADVNAGDPDLNYDNVNDNYTWAARRIAKRIKTISDQFRTEYGASFSTTVRPILATQVEWPAYWLVDGLNFLNARYGPPSNYLYACAGAPYINLGDTNNNANMTESQVVNALTAGQVAMTQDLNVEACETMSRYNNLQFLGYEGGTDTSGPNGVAAKAAAMNDPLMKGLVENYMTSWFQYGSGFMNWYTGGASNYDSQYGSWGITDDMTHTSSQKLQGIQYIVNSLRVPLTQGMAVPGNVNPMQYCMRDTNWQTEGMLTLTPGDWRGPSRDYLLRTIGNGNRTITISADTSSTNPVSLQVFLNNSLVGTVSVSSSTFANTATLTTPMSAGMNVIRVQIATGDNCTLQNISIQNSN